MEMTTRELNFLNLPLEKEITDMPSYQNTAERIHRIMESEKLALHEAQDNELLIDLDDTQGLGQVRKQLDLINRHFKITKVYKRRSKGRKGWHIRAIMKIAFFDPRERQVLHLIAGSDPVRELIRMNAIRWQTSDQTPIFLDKPAHKEVLWLVAKEGKLVRA